jgi:hypothetical protein
MTSPVSADPFSALPTSTETTDVLRFLRRFADLMSTGSNSDNLLRAARSLETHSGLLKEAMDRLKAERIRADADARTRTALEARAGELEHEALGLTSRLSEQQARAGSVAMPLSILLVAKAQFEQLAAAFEKSGNIVSQVMCEASASTLDRVIRDADAADGAKDRAQDAA